MTYYGVVLQMEKDALTSLSMVLVFIYDVSADSPWSFLFCAEGLRLSRHSKRALILNTRTQ